MAQQSHWKSYNVKQSGVDDLVLLSKLSEETISKNLEKRYDADQIFTYIGPVLISVNPFKQLSYFTDREVELYQGANLYENPPHIYATADHMYRNLTIDNESQCVIISGESGAGKTVCAKFVMNYISRISGGGPAVDQVKQIILASNPLLEAFGNAKTLRNNNSSRFGKYMEMSFNGGQPVGGKVTEFLLEKSRVVSAGRGERNFHIFYQLTKGEQDPTQRRSLGLESFSCQDFEYLAQTGEFDADGADDIQEYRDTLESMRRMSMNDIEIEQVLCMVAAILHMGNIQFNEDDREKGFITDPRACDFPAYLMGFDSQEMHDKLLTHKMETKWGKSNEIINVEHSKVKAYYTRDSLAKAIYSQIFKYLVEKVNNAIPEATQLNLGVLDIYGFEIFRNNGFEQFCINFVNEKLQQIFIELTLKAEQEEYAREGIQWTPIEFFNNIVVCDLIESKRPPGIFSITDDVTKQVGNKEHGVAETLLGKVTAGVEGLEGADRHYAQRGHAMFMITHYAGAVNYNAEGFVEKNRDQVFVDLLEMCKKSTNPFVQLLFKNVDPSKKQATQGSIIRTQANKLVDTLKKCQPHYVRTIKPNESKQANDWEEKKVLHQIKYLGLVENVRVRRAGFAYRRPFEKFLQRYNILTPETFHEWSPFNRRQKGDPLRAIHHIMKSVNMDQDQWQPGRSKVFIKAPESLFLLEELRERKFNVHARVIQKAYRKYSARKRTNTQGTEAARLLAGRKQRNRRSISRQFVGDYLGLDHDDRADLMKHLGRRERVLFAYTINKYNRKFISHAREMILTEGNLYFLGYRPTVDPKTAKKMDPRMIPYEPFIEFKIAHNEIVRLELSRFQDGYMLIRHSQSPRPILFDCQLKTEFIWALDKTMRKKLNKGLHLEFVQQFTVEVEASGFLQTKGWKKVPPRYVNFAEGHQNQVDLKSQKYSMNLTIATGADPRIMPDERPQVIGGAVSGGGGRSHLRPHHQNQPAGPGYGQMSVRHHMPSNTPQQHAMGGQSQNRPRWQQPPQQNETPRPQFYPPPPNHAPRTQNVRPPSQPVHNQSQRPDFRPPQFRLPSPNQDFSTSNSSGSRESLRCHDSGYSSTDRLNSQSGAVKSGGRGQFTGQFTGGQNNHSAGKWAQPQYARQHNQISNQNDLNHHSATNNNYRVELPLHHQITHSGMSRDRLPSGKDQSAPMPHRDMSIRAKHEQNRFNDSQFMEPELPDLPAQLQALNVNQQRGPPKIAPKPRPAPKPKRNPQARVLYDYDAQDNDEISLQEGQIIEILKEDENGWFNVKLNNETGLYPGNYLEKI